MKESEGEQKGLAALFCNGRRLGDGGADHPASHAVRPWRTALNSKLLLLLILLLLLLLLLLLVVIITVIIAVSAAVAVVVPVVCSVQPWQDASAPSYCQSVTSVLTTCVYKAVVWINTFVSRGLCWQLHKQNPGKAKLNPTRSFIGPQVLQQRVQRCLCA